MYKFLKIFYEFIILNIGCILLSVGTSIFLLPNKISNGGFSGIATIIYYLYDIQMSVSIILLNIPFFILAYKKIGKGFIIKSLYATIVYSYMIDYINDFIFSYSNNISFEFDLFISSIYGGILVGLGCAFVYKVNGSTGGTDLIVHLINSYTNRFKVSECVIVIDFFVVLLNIICFKEIEIGLYSWITIFIVGKIIDVVFEGINFCKIVFIISDSFKEISDCILENLNRGATSIYAKGLYLNKEKEIIMCIVKRSDVIKIKNLSKKIDKNSFIVVTDAREVYGLGFK